MHYIQEIHLYSKYFFEIVLTYKESIIYRLFFPIFMIIMQSFNNEEEININNIVLWLSFMLFNSAVHTIIETLYLREQGYLKQYHSLVSGDWIFIISKGLVEFTILLLGTLVILLFLSLVNINELHTIIHVFSRMLITYCVLFIPLVCLISLLLLFPINKKNISLISGIVPTMMIIGTFAIQWTDLISDLPLISFFNPLMVIGFLFYEISGFTTSISWINFLLIIGLYILIGILSIKNMRILPKEG